MESEVSRSFARRHIGLDEKGEKRVLSQLDAPSVEEFLGRVVPKQIRTERPLALPEPLSEFEALAALRKLASHNRVARSYIGMGYYDTVTPPVIQRQVLENPNWYTAYTPYQAEIAQGRLEALLNFQTMVCDLTGMPVANASLLDEGTAAAEAMALALRTHRSDSKKEFFVSDGCHPQVIAVVQTRAEPLGIRVCIAPTETFAATSECFGALFSYPDSDGKVMDLAPVIAAAKSAGVVAIVSADLLALTLLTPPGELGADIVVGTTQRFGVPLGFGGPHAAFIAGKNEFARQLPGRIVGVSKDSLGRPAFRLAIQTREQHIRREKATSNICTAQVLLAVTASMYAVYHGPEGLREIASSIHKQTATLADGLSAAGYKVRHTCFFDTLRVDVPQPKLRSVELEAEKREINFRWFDDGSIGISLDETVTDADLRDVLACFGAEAPNRGASDTIPPTLKRKSVFLTHPVFHKYHSESEMLRYLHRLETKDLSLTTSMIPLGSCTMKLNAAAEMMPVTWPEFSRMHPFAPLSQAKGYLELFRDLESMLAEITGFDAVSLQPNAGSQGEYAGLLCIRHYHESRGDNHRTVCLIPESAHGTNPASAAMVGMEVVAVRCDESGNVDIADLEAKAKLHEKKLSCVMVTYPSTHGVYEEGIRSIAEIVHRHGGLVYMDGANLNAQVAVARPGEFGMDVCHLNLHKTFCIPHGGGGPGMAPIAVAKHLTPFLPTHFHLPREKGRERAVGAIASAPWGSPSILVIPWMYLRMMGSDGLADATAAAILNANYVASRLDEHFPVLYRGVRGLVAHECILDVREIQKRSGVDVTDIAKRLMDYGFHAPTVSFPVPGTMMVEPTESESIEELDRFCDALIAIREEIREVETGKADKLNNLLKNAPHTMDEVCADSWDRPYSRERAAFPLPYVRQAKYWPPVGRIDSAYGDRNLVCTCGSVGDYES